MEKSTLLIIAFIIFLIYNVLFWYLFRKSARKEYGSKMWNYWPTRLTFWQAILLYSGGLTVITLYLLRWFAVLNF